MKHNINSEKQTNNKTKKVAIKYMTSHPTSCWVYNSTITRYENVLFFLSIILFSYQEGCANWYIFAMFMKNKVERV